MAASCIVCFVGLPASGKTTFSLRLKEKLKQDVNSVCVILISLDSIISLEEQQKLAKQTKCDPEQSKSIAADNENQDWKKLRQNIVAAVSQLLTEEGDKCALESVCQIQQQILHINQIDSMDFVKPNEQKKIFIMDDNLYYRSMRYDYFQLARKFRCGFLEIYMQCPLGTAIKRNSTRKCIVPDEVISNMASRMEEPAPGKYYWEENAVIIDSEKDFTDDDIALSINRIFESLSHPYQPFEDGASEKELSRTVTSRSALHQIDTTLRRLTSQTIKKYKGEQESGHAKYDLKEFSSYVNAARTSLLSDIKTGVITFPDKYLSLIELGQIDQFHNEAAEMLLTMLTKRIEEKQ